MLTAFTMASGLQLHTVGDMGALLDELPFFALPQVPMTFETLIIILPYALTLTMVRLLESLMTAAIIDEMTDTTSNKNRECAEQGLANITSGLFGGMAGCAIIGQSVINVSSGGRGRLSCLWAGEFLLFLIVVLATVTVIVTTHDLAKGVLVGVILSGLFFAQKVSRFFGVASTVETTSGVRTYRVAGKIFFATAEAFHSAFDFREELDGRHNHPPRCPFLGHHGD